MPYIFTLRRKTPRRQRVVAAPLPIAEPVAVTAPEPVPERALEDLTKAELVALADQRGLVTYGSKADIIERING